MPTAVIDIGPDGVGVLVAKIERNRLLPLWERRVPLAPARVGPAALFDVVKAESGRARHAGAERVEVVVSPKLRASQVLRGLLRRLSEAGAAAPRILSQSEEAELRFYGATALSPPSAPATTAVVRIGETFEITVGRHGEGLEWLASRPLSVRAVTQSAARSDPPTVEQWRAISSAVARSLSTLHPPRADELVVNGPHSDSFELLFGATTVEPGDTVDAREQLEFAHSEVMAARLGVEPHRSRQLPVALEVLDAAMDMFESPATIVHGGLREGALLLTDSRASNFGAGARGGVGTES